VIDRTNASRIGAAARGLTLLRLVAGSIYLYAGAGKLTWYTVAGVIPLPVVSLTWQMELPARLAAWLASHPTGALAAVVRDILIPNGMVVAAAVAWGQAIVGAMLLLGLFTSAASVAAALIAGTLAVAAASQGPVDARPYILLIALCVAFIVGRAGHTAGLDAWRHERRRNRDL
jgi:uncharacterized membrane protein YphA (DoxX/SURF4 family)